MKRVLLVGVVLVAMVASIPAQAKRKKPVTAPATVAAANAAAKPAATPAQPQPSNAQKLEDVLKTMDQTAASFQSVQADFEWDQYSKVIDEISVQKGVMYFRRQGNNIEMAADINSVDNQPDQKYVLFVGGLVQVYQPKIDQITKYSAGKNKADFESFLVLGFGGRGHDLAKSFDVKYGGEENVGGTKTAKLELTPKAERVRNMFSLITLWIDPARGVSVQQKFLESSGDYRLAKYFNIKANQKLPESAFKLKTTGKTKVVTPQS